MKANDKKSRIRRLRKDVETLEGEADKLAVELVNEEFRWIIKGAECPNCGTNERPEVDGFAQAWSGECPECDYKGNAWY